jgi:2-phospho-L-lactate guanylyltransferase
VRSLHNGKTRLSPVLDPEERSALLRRAAKEVVRAALESGVVETVLVVSPEPDVLAWAAELGSDVVGLPQPVDQPGLNGAIAAGREWAEAAGADAMLSLFADLPLLEPEDIRGLVTRTEPVVLGPDRRGEGTNALLLRLAGEERASSFRFAFGEGSVRKHLAEAARHGLDAGTYDAKGIAFDLDTPEDWTDYLTLAAIEAPAFDCCAAGTG